MKKQQENKSVSKQTLLSAIIVLIVCVAMLFGTTFAWFTDSVSNTGNRIQAGSLKIDLLMDKTLNTSAEDDYVSIKDGVGDIFKEADVAQNSNATLWEPGKTQIVYLAVENQGNLALKYNAYIHVTDEGLVGSLEYALFNEKKYTDLKDAATWSDLKALADSAGDVAEGTSVINTGVLDEITKGTKNERDYVALAIHMKEDASNDYQGKDVIVDVAIVATQMSAEADGFDSNTYDANAEFDIPVMPIHVEAKGTFNKKTIADNPSTNVVLESPNEVKATVSSNSAVSVINEILPEAQQGDAADTDLLLKINVDTTSSTEEGVTYEINLTGKVTTTKAGVKTQSEEKQIKSLGDIAVVELNIDKGLEDVKVKHSGVSMTQSDTHADQTFTYDKATGLLTLYTSTFSPFEVDYNYELFVLDADGFSYKTSLVGFADLVNTGKLEKGCKAYLIKDVDLKNVDWYPIGNWMYPFHGEFYGGKHSIEGLSSDGSHFDENGVFSTGRTTGYGEVFGFFGIVGNGDFTIKDVNFTEVNIVNQYALNVGTIIGYIPKTQNYTDVATKEEPDNNKGGYYAPGKWDGVENVGKVKALIENVTVDGTIAVKTHVGGFIGKNYSEDVVTLKNCVNNAKLSASYNGGLAGFVGYNIGRIEMYDCCNGEAATLTFKRNGETSGIYMADFCYNKASEGSCKVEPQKVEPNYFTSEKIIMPDPKDGAIDSFSSQLKNGINLTGVTVTDSLTNYTTMELTDCTAGKLINYGVVTIKNDESSNSEKYIGIVRNYGEATIKSGKFNGEVDNGTSKNYENAEMTIEGGIFNNVFKNYGTATIEGGKFTYSKASSFSTYGETNIKKGDFSDLVAKYSLYVGKKGNLTISGGSGSATKKLIKVVAGGELNGYDKKETTECYSWHVK